MISLSARALRASLFFALLVPLAVAPAASQSGQVFKVEKFSDLPAGTRASDFPQQGSRLRRTDPDGANLIEEVNTILRGSAREIFERLLAQKKIEFLDGQGWVFNDQGAAVDMARRLRVAAPTAIGGDAAGAGGPRCQPPIQGELDAAGRLAIEIKLQDLPQSRSDLVRFLPHADSWHLQRAKEKLTALKAAIEKWAEKETGGNVGLWIAAPGRGPHGLNEAARRYLRMNFDDGNDRLETGVSADLRSFRSAVDPENGREKDRRILWTQLGEHLANIERRIAGNTNHDAANYLINGAIDKVYPGGRRIEAAGSDEQAAAAALLLLAGVSSELHTRSLRRYLVATDAKDWPRFWNKGQRGLAEDRSDQPWCWR